MTYPLAERFVAPQGEGLYTGCVMAFLRTVGCSVGQCICTACDTSFDKSYPELGGGNYSADDLVEWARQQSVRHACVSGGEPLDRDLRQLLLKLTQADILPHIETSGTRRPAWLDPVRQPFHARGEHAVGFDTGQAEGRLSFRWLKLWLTVSPKPNYLPEMIAAADELKIILGGLGDGPGWPTVDDALRWADDGALVYVQPRNERLTIDGRAMAEAVAVVTRYPQLRLSSQLHKYISTR